MRATQAHRAVLPGLVAAAFCAGSVLSAGAAHAGTLASTFVAGSNSVHDASGEFYLTSQVCVPGPSTHGGTCGLQVGDTFLSIFDIGKNLTNGALYGAGSLNPQLTGVYALQVASVTPAGTTPATGTPASTITFTSVPNVAAVALAAGLGPTATTALAAAQAAHSDANTFAYVFSDPANPMNGGYLSGTPGAVQGDFDASTSGALVFSIDQAPGALTAAVVPTDPFDVGLAPSGVGVGGISGTATLQYQNTALLGFLFDANVGVAGNLFAPLGTAFPINDSYTFTLQANAIPEPASLSLLGMGLIGMGAAFRRRSRRNEG